MIPKQTVCRRTAGRRRYEHAMLQQRAPMSMRSMTGEDYDSTYPAELLSWSIGSRVRNYDVLVVLLATEVSIERKRVHWKKLPYAPEN